MKMSTILDQIDSGYMALPEFQHGYVWNREQVRSLFSSLYKRRPLGDLVVCVIDSTSADYRSGLHCFRSVDSFKNYVERDILREAA